MKYFIVFSLTVVTLASARPQQHQLDPSYLQQYYAQQQQQSRGADATPIYEQGSQETEQQYVQPGQQIRLKDNVSDQARQQAPQSQAYVSPSVRQYQPQAQQAQQVQYVQQPIQYKQVPKQTVAARRPPPPQYNSPQAPKYNPKEEEEDIYEEPQSYQFGFDVKDDEFTNYQNRKEVKDGNVIKGSYSVVDSDGFIRTVTYTADPKEGFKAEVVREPTDIVVKYPQPTPAPGAGGHRAQPAQNHQYAPAPQQQYRAPQKQQQQQQQQHYQYQ